MFETKSEWDESTRSSVLATDAVVLVGCFTNCDKEKTEHKFKKSLANVEKGLMVCGSVAQEMFGILKSPIRSKGADGWRDLTMLIASCSSLIKDRDDAGGR